MKNMIKPLLLIIIILMLIGSLSACEKFAYKGTIDDSIIKTTNSIIKTYGSKKSSSRLLNKENLSFFDFSGNLGNSIVSSMNADEFVLDISFVAKDKNSRINPNEIYAIFDCFLSLEEKDSLRGIIAIVCSYNRGLGLDDSSTWLISIPYGEFGILYSNTYTDGKNNNEIAKEMGDMWINKHHYNRFGLTFDDANKYREFLISQWKSNKSSYNEEFSASYYYGGNKLSVHKINRYNGVSSTQNIWSNPINETGFLYGAWDEQNNIWLYGETVGVQMYQFDGDSNWNKTESVKLQNAPYPIKKVLEQTEGSVAKNS